MSLEHWQDEEISDTQAKFNIIDRDGNKIFTNVSLQLASTITQQGTPANADNINTIIDAVNGLLESNITTTWYRNNNDCVTKYADGTMVIDMNVYMVISPNSAYGTLYYCYSDLGVNFPVPFVDTPPICSVTLKANNAISVALNKDNLTKTRPGGTYFYAVSSLTNNTNFVEIHATGRWK